MIRLVSWIVGLSVLGAMAAAQEHRLPDSLVEMQLSQGVEVRLPVQTRWQARRGQVQYELSVDLSPLGPAIAKTVTADWRNDGCGDQYELEDVSLVPWGEGVDVGLLFAYRRVTCTRRQVPRATGLKIQLEEKISRGIVHQTREQMCQQVWIERGADLSLAHGASCSGGTRALYVRAGAAEVFEAALADVLRDLVETLETEPRAQIARIFGGRPDSTARFQLIDGAPSLTLAGQAALPPERLRDLRQRSVKP